MDGQTDPMAASDPTARSDAPGVDVEEIQLRSEDRAAVVATWKLTCARPCKWIGATFEAKAGSDVAMEELVLACDDITYA